MIVFIYKDKKRTENEIINKINDVLDVSDLLDGVTVSNNDKNVLKLLDKVYGNRDRDNTILTNDITKSSYNQAIVFGLCVVLSVFHVGIKRAEMIEIFLDKILTFVTLAIVSYLFSSFVKDNYYGMLYEEVYSIFKTGIEKLRNGVNY